VDIANILHRDAIAGIVGKRTFERGEQCFAAGRVLDVRAAPGELRGLVVPQEAGRAHYVVRIWVHDDGMAYQCSCPIGSELRFCKHAVALALAHLDRERRERDALLALRTRLLAMASHDLVERLVERARTNPELRALLEQLA
jgi:uncharacterized Zn finger protein